MEGIEILASETVVTDFVFNWALFKTVFRCELCFIPLLFVAMYRNVDIKVMQARCIIFVLCALLVAGIIGGVCYVAEESQTQYKVLVSGDVKMSDFLDHYEIISQEGKIITVREMRK